MNNREQISMLITKFSGQNNVIPIPVVYLQITEDYPTAALLNQIVYWSDRTGRKDGYFYKSYIEWEEEIFLSEKQVRRAINRLKEMKIVETKLKKANGAPTLHYKVSLDNLAEWILTKGQNGNLQKVRMETDQREESLTEITTEITTERKNNSLSVDKRVLNEQNLINEFNEWYDLYDNKKDRKGAITKFKAARKKHSFEEIMDGTKAYLKTITDKKYQKYPKTFLYNESYLDEHIPQNADEPVTGNIFDEMRAELRDEYGSSH